MGDDGFFIVQSSQWAGHDGWCEWLLESLLAGVRGNRGPVACLGEETEGVELPSQFLVVCLGSGSFRLDQVVTRRNRSSVVSHRACAAARCGWRGARGEGGIRRTTRKSTRALPACTLTTTATTVRDDNDDDDDSHPTAQYSTLHSQSCHLLDPGSCSLASHSRRTRPSTSHPSTRTTTTLYLLSLPPLLP